MLKSIWAEDDTTRFAFSGEYLDLNDVVFGDEKLFVCLISLAFLDKRG